MKQKFPVFSFIAVSMIYALSLLFSAFFFLSKQSAMSGKTQAFEKAFDCTWLPTP